jgi:hypothetical protein
MNSDPIFVQPKAQMLNKIYIANVKNRLRELSSPSKTDMQRWVYELLQNAKDSIVGDPSRSSVDIEITATNDELEFKHNGSPFTGAALLGLLYKYSDGKENVESTGRFGTGFLTTHCLSKEVQIIGDILEESGEVSGFSVTIYRSGDTDEELLKGGQRMESGWQRGRSASGWTTFKYRLLSEQNKKAMDEGLGNLRTNAALTLLFSPTIRTIAVDDRGKSVRWERGVTSRACESLALTEIVETNECGESKLRRFLYADIEQESPELSEKYQPGRTVRLTVAIELGENDNVVSQGKGTPSHFCVFPLIGSEGHVMPVVINSPDFEPNSERENLMLSGPDRDPVRQVPTECGINRMILLESIQLFDLIVHFLSPNHHDLHFLLKGLRTAPYGLKSFDCKWFDENIISGYRAVLKKYPIVESDFGRVPLFQSDGKPHVLFVKADDDDPSGTLYSLVRDYYGADRIARRDLNERWVEFVWNDCGLVTIESLCKQIHDCKKMAQLRSKAISGFDGYKWLNTLFQYLESSPAPRTTNPLVISTPSPRIHDLSRDFAIFPNRGEIFLSLNSPGIALGHGLTPVMLEVLKDLGEDLSPSLVHPAIDSLSSTTIQSVIDAEALSQSINKRVAAIVKEYDWSRFSSWNFSQAVGRIWPILRIVSTDLKYPEEFRARQQKVMRFMSSVHDRSEPRLENNDLCKIAWSEAHQWSKSHIVRYVSAARSLSGLQLRNVSD